MRNRVIVLLALIATIVITDLSVTQAQPPYRRRNISTFSPADQLELRQLMMTYINNVIVNEHLTTPGIHCENEFFLTWHRGYIDRMEAWLMTQTNGTKYLPLPKWDPNNVLGIPNAFFNNLVSPGSAVLAGYPALVNQNISGFGNFNFTSFTLGTVCATYPAGTQSRACTGVSFGTAIDNFALALERQHNNVHGDIGGVMGNFNSPAAAIFFLWHAYIDDHYRFYQCTCQSAKVKDLYMKDNKEDVGDEPNNTEPSGVMWQSPDVWVRQNQDPIVGGVYQHENDANRHENPEYKNFGQNYVYVRIRNLGCARVNAGEVNLRVYWSKASSGVWIWPNDWTNTPPLIPPHGDEITLAPIAVPALDPGQQWVAEVPWTVPDPALYPLDPNHFCLLARLESVVDPMAVIEGTDVYANTKNNNNVAWRNVMVYDVDPLNIAPPPTDDCDKFFFKLVRDKATTGKLRFAYNGNRAVRFTVNLGTDLYEAWAAGGRASRDVVDLGNGRLQINAPNAEIAGLKMQRGVLYRPCVQAYLQNDAKGGKPDVAYGDVVPIHVVQYESEDGGKNEEIVGGLTYELRAVKTKATEGKPLISAVNVANTTCPQSADGGIKLTMANAAGQYTYWWSHGASTRDVAGLTAGTYTVYVRDAAGVAEVKDIVVKSNSNLATDVDGTNSSCGGNNGSAKVGVTGGRPPYKYQWYVAGAPITNAIGNSLTRIAAGDYSVVVSDAAGCAVTANISVYDEMSMLEVFATATDASSEDAVDGSAEAVAVGMPPYSYLWNNGSTGQKIEGLAPGEYTVTVTDQMRCSVSRTVVVGFPQALQGVDRQASNELASIVSAVPNPANNEVDVRYVVKHAGTLRIALYDDMGRMVDVAFNGYAPVGDGLLRIDTRGLPSGRYAIHLMVGGRVATMPLVIVH